MDPRRTHAETAQGWNRVAASKYQLELDERITLLRSGRSSLLDVELVALKPLVAGASVVHLQCSHGLDTLSLLDLGAASVVGLDISSEMIRLAQELAHALGRKVRWFCADVLDPPAELEASADLVYTGKGSLPWIMDLEAWATAVRSVLKPGGTLYVLEGHPLDNLWHRESPIPRLREDSAGYFDEQARENPGFPAAALQRVQTGAARPIMRERFWRPDQVMAALSRAGLRHESYSEHPDLFWDQFPHWPDDIKRRLPHSYSLQYRRL
jgi:SAM-dependent methyltransferase